MEKKGYNGVQKNNFKHIAGTAQAINDMGIPRALGYALFKEPHFQQPNLDGEDLYNYVHHNYMH